jgi:3',5'-nucleoside bisphosphate phosphatase
MIKKIDLHVHTKASDGVYTPTEIIDYAIKNGISSLAITDHDTLSGLPEAMDYAKKTGYDLIPGIEFGLQYPAGSFHLVGLFVDYFNPALLEITERLKKSRLERINKIIESLKEYNIDLSLLEIEKEASGAALGKPHIARLMVKKGYAADLPYVFKNYMIKGKPGHVKRDRITLNEAVIAIKNAGGIPIIAHPVSLNFKSFDEFEKLLIEFIQSGVEGLEVYSSMHTMKDVTAFLDIAEKNNILVSGGSDFHDESSKQIGVYTDGNYVPDHLLNAMRQYRSDKKNMF